jgi:hypothetical protein
MKERLQKIAEQATTIHYSGPGEIQELDPEKFAELIVELCIETLEFYGHNKAIPDIEFMARNRLGVMK